MRKMQSPREKMKLRGRRLSAVPVRRYTKKEVGEFFDLDEKETKNLEKKKFEIISPGQLIEDLY